MNKLVNPLGFCNLPLKSLSAISKCFSTIKIDNKYNNSATSNSINEEFSIQTIGIKQTLKKTLKYESFVYRSFFGELDPDYLIYPTLVANVAENQLFTQQSRFIRKNFVHISKSLECLKNSGFLDWSLLTEVEKTCLFEALGSSLECKSSNSISEISKGLIKLNKLTVTNSFLFAYEEKKKFLKSILPLVIHNSLVLNTIQSSNNQKILELCLSDFKNLRIAFAFDEPNDDFVSPPYPYWESTALFDSDTNIWTLNGKKSRILENEYDYFLIFCKIKSNEENYSNKVSDYGIASFFVPNDHQQLKIESDGTDNYGTNFLKISFKRLNLLKEKAEVLVDRNATSLLNIKSSGHLMISAILLGIMKQLLENIVLLTQESRNVPYRHLIENYVTLMTEMIYTLESMLYLTSSHYDTFELDQIDLYLQAMIVKILASEYSEAMIKMTRFLFESKYLSPIVSNGINDVVNVLNGFLDSSTSTRMLLANYGLRSIGNWRFDHIIKMRLNRIYELHFIKYQINRFRKQINLRYKEAKDGFHMLNKLNPSLKESAEYLKQVLEIESEIGNHILQLYGKECVKYQIDLNRFSSMIMSAFQMVSLISRANGSLKKNSRFASQEFLLCKKICQNSYRNVKSLEELVYGVLDTSEEKRSKAIHQYNMRFDGYFARSTFDRVI